VAGAVAERDFPEVTFPETPVMIVVEVPLVGVLFVVVWLGMGLYKLLQFF
jgi:hypothetical protein